MSVLVLGGAGYIGAHTVYRLMESGFRVVVADNLSTGHRWAVHPKAVFYQGDLRDRAFLNDVFRRETIEGVIHFAAFSVVSESMTDPLKYYSNNLCGTETLLETMLQNGVRKLVFSSSAAVYGEPERLPIPETAPTRPANCYGETKLAIEKMLCWTASACGLRYAALRYFNACGARPDGAIGEDHVPETHLIPLALQAAVGERKGLMLYGDDYPTPDGTCIRDYVHVCDLAQAHILALRHLDRGGESGPFNLGTGSGYSVREILSAAERVTGRSVPVERAPRRPGDPAQLIASCEKAKTVLGWRPEYTQLDRIVETAWIWQQAKRNLTADRP